MSRPDRPARDGAGPRVPLLVAIVVVTAALGVGAAAGGQRAQEATTRRSLDGAHVLVWTDVWAPTVQSRTARGATLSVALGVTLTSGPPLRLDRLRLAEGSVAVSSADALLTPGVPQRLNATFAVRCPSAAPSPAQRTVWADVSLADGTTLTLPTWTQKDAWTLPEVARTTCGVAADRPPVAVWTMDATPEGAVRLSVVGHGETFDLALADPSGPGQSGWSWNAVPALPVRVPEGDVVSVTVTLAHRGCPAVGAPMPLPPRLVPVTDGRQRTGRSARYPDGWSDAAVASAAAAAVVRQCR